MISVCSNCGFPSICSLFCGIVKIMTRTAVCSGVSLNCLRMNISDGHFAMSRIFSLQGHKIVKFDDSLTCLFFDIISSL